MTLWLPSTERVFYYAAYILVFSWSVAIGPFGIFSDKSEFTELPIYGFDESFFRNTFFPPHYIRYINNILYCIDRSLYKMCLLSSFTFTHSGFTHHRSLLQTCFDFAGTGGALLTFYDTVFVLSKCEAFHLCQNITYITTIHTGDESTHYVFTIWNSLKFTLIQ